MIELNELVFGKIKSREILGADPDIENTRNMLEQEIIQLIQNLKELTKNELEFIKIKQREIEKIINSRPGAMALPQNKIKLFIEYNTRYVRSIEEEINLRGEFG